MYTQFPMLWSMNSTPQAIPKGHNSSQQRCYSKIVTINSVSIALKKTFNKKGIDPLSTFSHSLSISANGIYMCACGSICFPHK